MSFNILTIGDSVMWGQGNFEHDKFSTLVRDRLGSDLNQAVRIFNYSHSGAVLGVGRAAKSSNASLIALNDMLGEIPKQHASVNHQLESSKHDLKPEDVDLILLNGGANDLFIADFGENNPLLSLSPVVSKDKFVSDIYDTCYRDMKIVAQRAINMYPNAKLVIVGYYPIIAAFSKASFLVRFFLRNLLLLHRHLHFLAPVSDVLVIGVFLKLNKTSRLWRNKSNKAFEKVVKELNESKPNVAAFAKSNIKSRNACFVSFPRSNWLWEFTPKPFQADKYSRSLLTTNFRDFDFDTFFKRFIVDSVANDSVANERMGYALEHVDNKKNLQLEAGLASFSHPNILGCISISQSIISELQGLGVIDKPRLQKGKNLVEKVTGTFRSLKASIRKFFSRK